MELIAILAQDCPLGIHCRDHVHVFTLGIFHVDVILVTIFVKRKVGLGRSTCFEKRDSGRK